MFRISPLPYADFAHLFDLDDTGLAARGGVRLRADRSPGFPCRVSLADADVGEELILVHYEHQNAASPFRASHAVYIRRDAREAWPAPSEVPASLGSRMLSLRAFDAAGMMIDADLCEGRDLEHGIARLLADSDVAYIHAHYARQGCYAARIDRAG